MSSYFPLPACHSLEEECGTLRSQLEQERAVTAERQGDYKDALQQLDSLRWAAFCPCLTPATL
jgi:hypothetical protein